MTGGNTGIGLGISKEFARANYDVVIMGVRPIEELQKVANEVEREHKRKVHAVHCDVTKAADCKDAIAHAISTAGRIDVLVNNAGIEGEVKNVEDYSESAWDAVMNVNVRSNFYMCKYVIPHFRARWEKEIKGKTFSYDDPHPHAGSIIVLSSIAGKQGIPTLTPYCASNFARIGFAKSLGMELVPYNVNVNALCESQ